MRGLPSRAQRLVAAVACAALLTALGGCGRSGEEQVRDTVDQFVHARNDADFEKVCDIFDPVFRQDQGLGANCAEILREQSAGQPPPGDTKIVSIKVKGDRATVELDASQGGEAPSRLALTLVRHDGDWKVAGTT